MHYYDEGASPRAAATKASAVADAGGDDGCTAAAGAVRTGAGFAAAAAAAAGVGGAGACAGTGASSSAGAGGGGAPPRGWRPTRGAKAAAVTASSTTTDTLAGRSSSNRLKAAARVRPMVSVMPPTAIVAFSRLHAASIKPPHMHAAAMTVAPTKPPVIPALLTASATMSASGAPVAEGALGEGVMDAVADGGGGDGSADGTRPDGDGSAACAGD